MPVRDDDVLFELLILEGAQAGLSWATILGRREGYRRALHGFDAARIARYGARDTARLMADPGIIRNRLKVAATIGNARAFLALREQGPFADSPVVVRRRKSDAQPLPHDRRRAGLDAGSRTR